MKSCTRCGETKPVDSFPRDSSKSDGRYPRCKVCRRLDSQQQYIKRKERNERERIFVAEKACTRCGESKSSRKFSRSPLSIDGLAFWCKTCMSKYSSSYRDLNIDAIRERSRRYEEENRDKISRRKALYCLDNKERILYRNYEWEKGARASDPMFYLRKICRARVSEAFSRNGYRKKTKTEEMIGCSWQELCSHLESQFKPGMTWENRGEWHIDHIVPLASADTEDDLMSLCHYTNLQPLWAEENLRKGARVEWGAP